MGKQLNKKEIMDLLSEAEDISELEGIMDQIIASNTLLMSGSPEELERFERGFEKEGYKDGVIGLEEAELEEEMVPLLKLLVIVTLIKGHLKEILDYVTDTEPNLTRKQMRYGIHQEGILVKFGFYVLRKYMATYDGLLGRIEAKFEDIPDSKKN